VKEKRKNETPEQKKIRDKKQKLSCIENNGIGNQTNNKKRQETNLERYGFTSYSKTDEFKHKLISAKENNFKSVILPLLINKIESESNLEIIKCDVNNIRDKITLKCDKGHIFERIVNNAFYHLTCPKCNNNGSSFAEIDVYNHIKDNINLDVLPNKRDIISPLELDIYIPDKNIAIEYNGLYWHNDSNDRIDKNYHLNKTKLCEEKGIQLIHVFENEWLLKPEIVKSILLSKLGKYQHRYYARKCNIKEIGSKIKNEFLEKHHLQGSDRSSIKLGLFHEKELLSVMTFGRRKITGGNSAFELIRFSNKLNTQVVGGASKLFKHFTNNYIHDGIVTYADRRYSNGEFYKELGFELSHISNPNYFYYNSDMILLNRINFQKHKLKGKLKSFDDRLTENENMSLNGYKRI
jgi:hypothetical protein